MICVDDCISKEVADYLNSHPAFIYSQGCIINPDFFDNYIREFTDEHKGTVPIADKYRKAVWGQRTFTMDDAEEFLKWLDPKWTEYTTISNIEPSWELSVSDVVTTDKYKEMEKRVEEQDKTIAEMKSIIENLQDIVYQRKLDKEAETLVL